MLLLPVRYEAQLAAEPNAETRRCYVLETDRGEDRWVLEDLCRRQGWPLPQAPAAGLFTVWRARGWFSRRSVPRDLSELGAWLEAAEEVEVLPVAIFWGRAPSRDHSWIKLWFSEDWGLSGRVRRVFRVLVHGRDVLVKVGDPISVTELASEDDPEHKRAQRKLGRMLRVYFQQQRSATVGPDLSHRRLLLEEVLQSPLVVEAVRREVRGKARATETRVRARAARYAREIAADYSYPMVRMLDRVLAWLWNRLYSGIEVEHLAGLADIEAGAEVVYVPCHRSHIDYLLLGFVIFRQGLAPPHTAAGINLNFPLIGSVLRRGGAFFIRRSFQGNALYAAVFRSYLRQILERGFPVKYFIEGARSRTGKLLKPKLGLLLMTVEAYMANRSRPIVFVPVYFGYEKLIEGPTFLGELRGRRKRRETLGGFLRSLQALRGRFGQVQVSFAQPIALEAMLDSVRPDWRDATLEEHFRPEWVGQVVAQLGDRILTAINEAAVVNSVSLVALVLLCTPKEAIVEVELKAQLELYLELFDRARYSKRAVCSVASAEAAIRQSESLGWLERKRHPLGDILRMHERTAILASYFRNNIVHLFVLPGLLAAAFANRNHLTWREVEGLVANLHACLRKELYLSPGTLARRLKALRDAMEELGLLEQRNDTWASNPSTAAQLELCAQIVRPFLERYYLGVAVLLGQGSGRLRRVDFIARCSEAAEQLALIYSLHSPDLFQTGLFDNLVSYLEERGVLSQSSQGVLSFETAMLDELANMLGKVLPPQLRRTLLNLAGTASLNPSSAVAGSR